MRKNQVRNVIVHVPEDAERIALTGRISRFHADLIERRLEQLVCSPGQKAAALERIISNSRNSRA